MMCVMCNLSFKQTIILMPAIFITMNYLILDAQLEDIYSPYDGELMKEDEVDYLFRFKMIINIQFIVLFCV